MKKMNIFVDIEFNKKIGNKGSLFENSLVKVTVTAEERKRQMTRERNRKYRLKKKLKNLNETDRTIGVFCDDSRSRSVVGIEYQNDVTEYQKTIYSRPIADFNFRTKFTENTFGHECKVCDRIWFKNDLSSIPGKPECLKILTDEFPGEDVENFKLCGNSFFSINNF